MEILKILEAKTDRVIVVVLETIKSEVLTGYLLARITSLHLVGIEKTACHCLSGNTQSSRIIAHGI